MTDPIKAALAELGLFQVPQPPLREQFSDWLVDALKQERFTRRHFGLSAWRNEDEAPAFLEEEEIP